jgi:beta-lactamase regulating signal transducer with metallopeptidase domain
MQALGTLGAGVVLAWLSLPILVWIARRDGEAEPRSRHWALIVALVLSALLLGIPALRALLETGIAGHRLPGALISSGLSHAPTGPSWGLSLPRVGAVVLSCIAAAWLLLVALRSLGIVLRIARIRGLLSRAAVPRASLRELLGCEARALGLSTPELLVSDEVRVPFTARTLRPVIVVSRAHAESADPQTLGLIFRHELLHVARHDVAVDVGVTLLLALFAGHPSARAMAREIRFAREAAVDADVAPIAPGAYANLLVTLAEQVHEAAELEVGMDDTELSARVRRILAGPRAHRRSARMVPVAFAFALLACSGAAVTAPESSAGAAGTPAAPATEFSVRLVLRDTLNQPATEDSAAFVLGTRVVGRKDVLGFHVAPVSEDGSRPERALVVALTPAGQRAMADATSQNVGQHMAIFVGDRLVAAPIIRDALTGPNFQITTNTDADLEALANALGASVAEAPPVK